jgi:hypothetical protein
MCDTNHEGYADPTAATAIRHMGGDRPMFPFMPIVYICSPYAGDVEGNTERARNYSRFAALHGYIPFTPHLLFPQFLDDTNPTERDLGLHFGKAILPKCAEVWVFGDRISPGMGAEIRQARRKGKRIRYFTEDMKEV